MVETITPVVHGGRTGRWARALAAHVVGAAAAAAAFGALLGLAGALLGAPWGLPGAIAVAVVAGVYALRELAGVPVPIPERRRQVPEWWRRMLPPDAASFLYGASLGIGFLTYLRHGTLVAVSAAAVAVGDPLLGAAVLLPFGIARSVAMAVVGGARTPDQVSGVIDRLERLGASTVPAIANGVALIALGIAVVVAGTGPAAGTPAPMPAMLLAVVFSWAALSKLARPRAWRETVDAHRLPGVLPWPTLIVVPAAEAAVAALALSGRVPLAAGVALAMLAGFSAALVRLRRLRGDRVPCGCFGTRRVRDVRVLLARNAALAVVAVAALGTSPTRSLVDGLRLARGPEVLPAALVAVGVAVAALLGRRAALSLRGR